MKRQHSPSAGASSRKSTRSRTHEPSISEKAYEIQKMAKQHNDLLDGIREGLAKNRQDQSDGAKLKVVRRNAIFRARYNKIKSVLDREVPEYARLSGLDFCAQIGRWLPKELRDMIFKCLTMRADVIGLLFSSVRYRPDKTGATYALRNKLCEWDYFCVDWVGKGVVEEIAEAYYSYNTFHICDSYELSGFLKGPYFDSFVPNSGFEQFPKMAPGECIRRLVIDVRGDLYTRVNGASGSKKKKYRIPSRLSNTLRSLLTIRFQNGFQLELRIAAAGNERLEVLLRDLAPLYSELLDAGFQVEVTCAGARRMRYPPILTAFFGCSREDWSKTVEEFRQGHAPPQKTSFSIIGPAAADYFPIRMDDDATDSDEMSEDWDHTD